MPSSPTLPGLVTRRLDLRALGEQELALLYEHWSVPEVGRWLWDEQVPARRQVHEELARSLASFGESGYGLWGLFRRRDGAFLGTCGLLPVPEASGQVEILFSIAPSEWRRGYAEEAATAVLRFGFEEAGLEEVVGRCDVPNEPSRRLLEKLGMELVERAPIRGVDCYHYRLRR